MTGRLCSAGPTGRARELRPQLGGASQARGAGANALLYLVEEHPEAKARFLDWLTGDTDVRAGELADAMIARAGRR